MIKTLENKRILLRKPNLNDVNDLYKIKNNKKTSKLLGGQTRDYTKVDIENWIQYHNHREDEEIFVIHEKINNIIIGHGGFYKIDYINKSAEYAILIGNNNFLGKGIGSHVTALLLKYGFEQLALNRISLSLLNENIAAYNLYSKIGFKREGCLKKSIWKNNKYYDEIIMAILKCEYESK